MAITNHSSTRNADDTSGWLFALLPLVDGCTVVCLLIAGAPTAAIALVLTIAQALWLPRNFRES